MYTGPADVAFFHHERPVPDQLDVYFNVGVDITLSEYQPKIELLTFEAGLVGVVNATHVRVCLPNGLEYEGEIKPRAASGEVTSLFFMVDRLENLSGEIDI